MKGEIFTRIVNKIAAKHNLPVEQVIQAWEFQFADVRNVILSDEVKTIKLDYLGKFHTNQRKMDKAKKKREQIEAFKLNKLKGQNEESSNIS